MIFVNANFKRSLYTYFRPNRDQLRPRWFHHPTFPFTHAVSRRTEVYLPTMRSTRGSGINTKVCQADGHWHRTN